MSDRFAGEIEIGGKVPKDLAQDLVDAVAEEGAAEGNDWGGKEFSPQSPGELMGVVAASGFEGILRLVNDQASFGAFTYLEAFCVKHGIAFNRKSEARYEYDAELVQFRSGMKEPMSFNCANFDDVLVPAAVVMQVVRKLEAALVASQSSSAYSHAVLGAVQQLREQCGVGIPALEPLEFV